MPCWYYDKKELRNTPSLRDGISAEVEARYRREGSRLIIDCGTKLGLRYDTCATGVVYFHRFYMFHSFRQFHRYLTAACCLFLAGKVEETPKKCRDILKVTRSMLTDSQFAVFGNDPREELMTQERILLQTIKFDLMVEHPYSYVLKFATKLKGDQKKIEHLVQMTWTFVNDSLCTNLCLQWESDIIAVALMYLGSRLTKVELNDWVGKVPGSKTKWYDFLVPDVTLDIIEDVCHIQLDLYSKTKDAKKEDSPPPPPPPPKTASTSTAGAATPSKRSRSPSPTKGKKSSRHGSPSRPSPAPGAIVTSASAPNSAQNAPKTSQGNSNNPYMSSKMYSSSFMSGEGSNAIQTLIGGAPRGAPPPSAKYGASKMAAPPAGQYQQQAMSSQYSGQQVPNAGQAQYQANPAAPGTSYTGQSYPASNTAGQYSSQYPQQSAQSQYSSQYQYQAPATGSTAATQYAAGNKQSYPGTESQYSAPPPPPQGAPYSSYGERTYAQTVAGSGSGYSQNSYTQPPPGTQGGAPYGGAQGGSTGYNQGAPPQGGGYNQYGGSMAQRSGTQQQGAQPSNRARMSGHRHQRM